MLHHRLLAYLDEVARSGSIRKAAVRLGVASSAINRQILALEAEMGAPLFERLPRGLRLTATGEILLRHVRDTLREHERMLTQISALKGLDRGEVAIATMATLAGGILADVVRDFRENHPHISLKIRVMTMDGIVETLLSGDVDLALAYRMPRGPQFRCLARSEHHLGAVMAPDHPLAGLYHLRLAQCLGFPLVVPDGSMSLRAVLEQLVPTHAVLKPAVETNSVELMKHLAQRAPHITFLNLSDIQAEIACGSLAFTPLRDATAITQSVSLIQRSQSPLGGPAYLVAARIGEALGGRGDPD
ncbi:DNA-binding transcriptional regulator, LysR family [Methylobacterium phyllostachyos]|uniref:DNA-binding transcriptional regulator, LysR family n=1 Tax=Methylobacterium phyllostachyos TaxID=582672 RepID=A0A1H0EKZ6_9HYPH|nr:DNA-binding transcriptional regulator, LysR family [Methylobacterium phyllostachyos]